MLSCISVSAGACSMRTLWPRKDVGEHDGVLVTSEYDEHSRARSPDDRSIRSIDKKFGDLGVGQCLEPSALDPA